MMIFINMCLNHKCFPLLSLDPKPGWRSSRSAQACGLVDPVFESLLGRDLNSQKSTTALRAHPSS